MKSVIGSAGIGALLIHAVSASVPAPTGGVVGACPGQGCDDCPVNASANAGYPHCNIYNSANTLGQNFKPAGQSTGYDVWWNSGQPNENCKIIVRTPASTDLPACGYYLTGWKNAGCYYTSIQDSFMLQYCCGSEDCEEASPTDSIEEAHYQALKGNATFVSLAFDEAALGGADGKRSIEGLGDVHWRRSDYAVTKREDTEKPQELRSGDCTFHPTSDKVTEGGNQTKATSTQVCNSSGGCSISASIAVTEGYSMSPSFTANFNFGAVVGATVGYTFTESKTFTVTDMYTQKSGTTGYLSFIPTLNCWHGTFSDCSMKQGNEITIINDKENFYSCTPALLSDGNQLDGTWSFVYVNQ